MPYVLRFEPDPDPTERAVVLLGPARGDSGANADVPAAGPPETVLDPYLYRLWRNLTRAADADLLVSWTAGARMGLSVVGISTRPAPQAEPGGARGAKAPAPPVISVDIPSHVTCDAAGSAMCVVRGVVSVSNGEEAQDATLELLAPLVSMGGRPIGPDDDVPDHTRTK